MSRLSPAAFAPPHYITDPLASPGCTPPPVNTLHCLQGLWAGVGALVLVAGHYEANADMMPTMQVVTVEEPTQDDAPTPSTPAAAAGAQPASPTAAQPVPQTPEPATAGPSGPVPPKSPRVSETGPGHDGMGVEGSKGLGRRMSITLRGRGSTGGTPLRQFSKNS
jgi:hypothetical protein